MKKLAINSRTKGRHGELEFLHVIGQELDVRLTRNLAQTREGGADLLVVNPTTPAGRLLDQFAIEIKRASTATTYTKGEWWKQAERQAMTVGKLPLLAHRIDRGYWRVSLPLRALSGRDDHSGIAELSLSDFLAWARSHTD